MPDTVTIAPAPAAETRRLRRTAGTAGIAAFLFWLLQPILVSLLGGETAGSTYERHQAHPFLGAYEAVAFGGIALGLVTCVLALDAVMRRTALSLALRVGTAFGLLGGLVWVVMAGLSLAPFSSVGFFLTEAVPGAAEQEAVYETLSLVVTGMVMVYALTMPVWLIVLASVGRRAGVVGWPLAVFALVAAVACLGALAVPFAPPFAGLAPLLFTVVLGVVLLVRPRRV